MKLTSFAILLSCLLALGAVAVHAAEVVDPNADEATLAAREPFKFGKPGKGPVKPKPPKCQGPKCKPYDPCYSVKKCGPPR